MIITSNNQIVEMYYKNNPEKRYPYLAQMPGKSKDNPKLLKSKLSFYIIIRRLQRRLKILWMLHMYTELTTELSQVFQWWKVQVANFQHRVQNIIVGDLKVIVRLMVGGAFQTIARGFGKSPKHWELYQLTRSLDQLNKFPTLPATITMARKVG